MGLYQYIREQAHRNDPVGELGRWLMAHPGSRPDGHGEAFELASAEAAACGTWTRQAALESLDENTALERIIAIEPRVGEIISDVLKLRSHKGYHRIRTYKKFKDRVTELVGFFCQNKALADTASYDTVIHAVDSLMPPDGVDLYSEGLPEEVQLDL
jgi:hypothetical protein